MKRVLLTGGCGFVGHHLAAALVKRDYHVTIIDKLTYASVGFARLREVGLLPERGEAPLVKVFSHDFASKMPQYLEEELGKIDVVLHVGAETHVDRSIADPEPFVEANVMGTLRTLQLAVRKRVGMFLYFSTDEIFGPAPAGTSYREDDRYRSGNPYAASKAGGEEMAVAFHNTYGLPVIVTHTMNLYGERQHAEKFIPKVVGQVLRGERVTVHADASRTRAGSRFYLYASDLVDAVLFLVEHGVAGEKYNVGGEREVSNLDVAKRIAEIVRKPLNYEMVDFHSARPGHDLRYALDSSKLHGMGFRHAVGFDAGLERTVKWYLANPNWLYDAKREVLGG